MSLNELEKKSINLTILGKFVNKLLSNSLWLIVFRKCFSLVKIYSTFAWHILSLNFWSSLINSWYLVFEVYFSPHQRNIVCEYKIHGKSIIFTCFWYWCWENLLFNVKLKLLINFNFSQLHCSSKQVFLKVWQTWQESTCVGVFFKKTCRLKTCNFI